MVDGDDLNLYLQFLKLLNEDLKEFMEEEAVVFEFNYTPVSIRTSTSLPHLLAKQQQQRWR